jgi:hypothetical protein
MQARDSGAWSQRRGAVQATPAAAQGHAVWHLLGAAAALGLFRSYERSQGILAA